MIKLVFSRPARLVILGLVGLVSLIIVLLNGRSVVLFDPKGLIAHEQLNLMVFTITLLLVIAVPSVFLLFFTAWKYRESNTKATHVPDMRHSKFLDLGMWLIPSVFMLVLA